MQRFIVSDIFGRTDALENMADQLPGQVQIIDPYNGKHMNFSDEADAYEYFVSHVGLKEYKNILINQVREISEPLTLLGFSVGASAIWSISDNALLKSITGALAFYGSQIRNAQEVTPRFPVKLIFPEAEKHFDVSELIPSLLRKRNTDGIQVEYLHGFMNYYSPNYDSKGYEEYLTKLQLIPEEECFCRIKLDNN
ncbi:dienelactone hydrolase family protein [Endozoicomonas arenosclerae]|uniref:dienelactone hydrolase family protein n=1 Tax=Endozoicomonas arenosclerae TaxID=1633495 RepID=UPI0007856B6B|nr:dienelactone hydrolase family protein [Endozoicomonas arenosclerae]